MKKRKFADGGAVPDFSRLTFKEAFQAARGGPDAKKPLNDTFTWNGKTYTTELEKPKAKSKPAPDQPQAETNRLRRQDDEAGPSVSSLPDMRDPAYRKSLEKSQALEPSPVGPEDVIGLPLRAVAGAAKLARAAKAAKQGARTFDVPEIGSELARRRAIVAKQDSDYAEYPEALKDLRDFLQSQNDRARKRKMAAAERRNKLRSLKSMGTNLTTSAINLGASRAVDAVKNRKPASETTDTPDYETGGMKKGGKVSAASTRGDGIAQRGKTRGKLR